MPSSHDRHLQDRSSEPFWWGLAAIALAAILLSVLSVACAIDECSWRTPPNNELGHHNSKY
jgi:hypothetical protein